MLLLLVVLLANYGGPSHNSQAFLLQKSIKQQLSIRQFLDIKRYFCCLVLLLTSLAL